MRGCSRFSSSRALLILSLINNYELKASESLMLDNEAYAGAGHEPHSPACLLELATMEHHAAITDPRHFGQLLRSTG